MRDEDKFTCPWCGRLAETVVKSSAEVRRCECGAVVIGAGEMDRDEITDAALMIFRVPVRDESRGYDAMMLRDLARTGVEIRPGVRDPDKRPLGFAYVYHWFRRTGDSTPPS